MAAARQPQVATRPLSQPIFQGSRAASCQPPRLRDGMVATAISTLEGGLYRRPMSALDQEPTYAVQQAMPALPPTATAKADIDNLPCLLYPRKQTCALQKQMSATGQWDTLGKKPNDPVEGFRAPLFGKRLIRLRWPSSLGTGTTRSFQHSSTCV
jgi:hypothetical protein